MSSSVPGPPPHSELQALTLDVIGRCAFGVEADSLHDRQDAFYRNARAFFSAIDFHKSWGLLLGFLFPRLSQLLRPLSAEGRAEKLLMDQLRDVIRRRQRQGGDQQGRVDLITLLLQQNQERLTGQKVGRGAGV